MKVCQVVFSTNRTEYLTRTMEAMQEKVDYSGLDLYKILIDDYPQGRNNDEVIAFADKYKFNQVLLHEENLGITGTWQHMFEVVQLLGVDYIFHHEDDVEPVESIKLLDLIQLLEVNKELFQVQLKRNAWYAGEEDKDIINPTDSIFKNYFFERQSVFFSMLFSVYPAWIANIDFKRKTGFCPSETVISWYLHNNFYQKHGAILKSSTGGMLVNHFGGTTRGKRVNAGEPGWESFANLSSEKMYNSKTGEEVFSLL